MINELLALLRKALADRSGQLNYIPYSLFRIKGHNYAKYAIAGINIDRISRRNSLLTQEQSRNYLFKLNFSHFFIKIIFFPIII